MALRGQLLHLLADGRFHSGAWLGRCLGISRSAVWQHIHLLQARQIDIHAVRGRGYRLVQPVELLSRQFILAHLDEASATRLTHLDILMEVDSSNRYLLSRARQGGLSGDVCLAEYQSAGRGRQGRHWVSPFAANIYLSLLWRFPCGADGLGGLSLAIGVSVLRAVHSMGAPMVRLKWPNDLVCQDKKLAGVLLEIGVASAGDSYVVIGVGLNVRMPIPAADDIDQAWTDLEQVVGHTLSRNQVAVKLIQQLLHDITIFEQQGLRPFIADWRQFDSLAGRPVSLLLAGETIKGVARGIDEHGALQLDIDGRWRRYLAGEVSVSVLA